MNNNKKNVTLSSGPTTTRVNMIDDWGDYFRSFNSYKPNQQYGTGVVEKPAEGTWETGVPNVITGVNHNISAAQAYMKIKENNIATAHKDYYRNWQEKIEQMEDEFDEHSNLSDEMYKSSNKAPGIKVVEHPANSTEDTLAKIRKAMKLKQARKSDKIESTMLTEEEVKKIQDNAEEAPDVDVNFKKPDVNMADAIMDFIGDDSDIEEPASETPVEEQEKPEEEKAIETIEEFIGEQKTEEPVEPEEEKAVETIEELADEEPVVATIEESAIIEEDEQNDNVLVAEESVSGNLEVEIEVPQQEEPEALDPFTEESLEMLQLLEESTMIEENKLEETVETEQEKQEIVEEKPVEPVAEAKATADDSKEKKSANAVSKKSTSSSKPKAKTSAKKKPATSKSKSSKNASKSSKTSKSKK